MKVADIKAAMPFEIIADGVKIGVFQEEFKASGKTKCPNCKLEYEVTPPDGRPFFFTIRHP